MKPKNFIVGFLLTGVICGSPLLLTSCGDVDEDSVPVVDSSPIVVDPPPSSPVDPEIRPTEERRVQIEKARECYDEGGAWNGEECLDLPESYFDLSFMVDGIERGVGDESSGFATGSFNYAGDKRRFVNHRLNLMFYSPDTVGVCYPYAGCFSHPFGLGLSVPIGNGVIEDDEEGEVECEGECGVENFAGARGRFGPDPRDPRWPTWLYLTGQVRIDRIVIFEDIRDHTCITYNRWVGYAEGSVDLTGDFERESGFHAATSPEGPREPDNISDRGDVELKGSFRMQISGPVCHGDP